MNFMYLFKSTPELHLPKFCKLYSTNQIFKKVISDQIVTKCFRYEIQSNQFIQAHLDSFICLAQKCKQRLFDSKPGGLSIS